jgi:hypothetical protein
MSASETLIETNAATVTTAINGTGINHSNAESCLIIKNENNNDDTTLVLKQSKIKIKDLPQLKINIPRISSRELHAQRPHSPPPNELEQREFVLIGPGSKREVNKLTVKPKNPELEECIKRAKKYAMEQSVRFVLIKQQQLQQKQQLDLIKKQQALLLMCRLVAYSLIKLFFSK